MGLGDVLGVDDYFGETVRIKVDVGVTSAAFIVIPRSVYLTADWESFGHQLARRQQQQADRLRGRAT